MLSVSSALLTGYWQTHLVHDLQTVVVLISVPRQLEVLIEDKWNVLSSRIRDNRAVHPVFAVLECARADLLGLRERAGKDGGGRRKQREQRGREKHLDGVWQKKTNGRGQ